VEHPLRYALYATIGLLIGAAGMALGAFLASGDNGWSNAILYSAVGVVGAPLAAVAWATSRYRRRLICAGVALLAGFAATMGILLELTAEFPHIVHATSQSPLAVAGWFAIWILWISAALARLILFEPPRIRHRLSSRRGDGGV
jgi:ABC-type Co2+ transport system permease subunit